jgi:hypothetical protein
MNSKVSKYHELEIIYNTTFEEFNNVNEKYNILNGLYTE